MRDIFTHKITTPEHWNMLMIPGGYKREELDYDLVVGPDTVVTPSYDPHCVNGDVTDGCEPVDVISAEKLRDYTEGPAETARIANVLLNDARTGQYVIAQEAWDCIWEELIQNGKGARTVFDRPGFVEEDYNFSAEMLQEMIREQNRLVTKYSGSEWDGNDNADRIVQLIVEHQAKVQTELNEVNSGVRKLTDRDFLGPKERARRRKLTLQYITADEQKDHSEYFLALEQKSKEKRLREMIELALRSERETRLKERDARVIKQMKPDAAAADKMEAEALILLLKMLRGKLQGNDLL